MDQAHRHVELAAHAARVGLGEPTGRLGQPEPLEQLVDPAPQRGAVEAMDPGLEDEVLATGRLGIHGDPLTDRADRPAHPDGVAHTSIPATVARPPSGRASVVRIRTVVDLPAPFGPSRPKTVPGSTEKLIPSSATTSPG